jgi:hypothetical protein
MVRPMQVAVQLALVDGWWVTGKKVGSHCMLPAGMRQQFSALWCRLQLLRHAAT